MITLVFLLIFVSVVVSTQSNNGHLVDSLKRFPHHVTIETDDFNWNEDENRICGGSILNEQWVVTSAFCIAGSERLQLHFEKLYSLSYNGSFTIAVNKDEIHMHPTFYYDIALIRLPIILIFSDTLKPVRISSSPVNLLEGRLAVVPGFDVRRKPISTTTTTTTTTTSAPEGTVSDTNTTYEWSSFETTSTTSESTTEWTLESESTSTTTTTEWSITEDTTPIPARFQRDVSSLKSPYSFDPPQQQEQLIYGMFRVLSNNKCKANNNKFDEFLQICTEDWIPSNYDSNPCRNYGSGLIVGWPGDSKLIGIYSVLLNNCSSSVPAVYTNIAEYLPWIESVIYTINP